jgi:hypothetical protein
MYFCGRCAGLFARMYSGRCLRCLHPRQEGALPGKWCPPSEPAWCYAGLCHETRAFDVLGAHFVAPRLPFRESDRLVARARGPKAGGRPLAMGLRGRLVILREVPDLLGAFPHRRR